jgi:hypothetical protein
MARCGFGLPLILLLASVVSAQSSTQSNSQAVALATQAIAALTSGASVTDVTLSGNAAWTFGTDNETGTATVYGKTNVESRLDLALGGGNRSEIRNSAGGSPQGAWINASGQSAAAAPPNCWTDAVWFFPALTSLSAVKTDATLVLAYVGLETQNGRSVQHIQSYHYVPANRPSATALIQRLSTVDYFLDSQTFVPLSITFNTHPDDADGTNIAVEIDFSNYQNVNGILVPFHITKLWQGNLLLDFTVTNVAINTGLPDSLFAIQ